MESNPSFPSSLEPFCVLLPIVRDSLTFLILGTVLSSFLIPTALILFFFSTPRLRRQPIFVFNVIAIVFGLIQGAINFVDATQPMLNQPEIPIASSTVAITLYVLVPLCVESVLILKVLAVYPPRLLSGTRCLALYLPIALIKAARVTNAGYFISLLLQGPREQDALSLAESVWHMPNAKVEWLLQLVDDIYVSGLFLYRIYTGTHGLVRPPSNSTPVRGLNPYLERIRTLFWISASNFVFPVFLNVAQLVLILRDGDFERGTLVLMVNNYVTIIGVLLATIWASGSEVRERASARWMTTAARGAAGRSPRVEWLAPRLGEKDPAYVFSRKRRPSSAPPTEKAVIVHVEESGEVSPSSIV